MGYYTSYNLEVKHVNTIEEHNKIVDALNEKGVWGDALREGDWNAEKKRSSFWNYDVAKWYDNKTDMMKISEEFPDAVFRLSGEGEESDDRWYALFKNGMAEVVCAQLTWPEPQRIKWEE